MGMMVTAAQFARMLKQLFPRGSLWNFEANSNLSKLLLGMSDEAERLTSNFDSLIEEIDPRTTNELLSDFERIYGLPDPCLGENQTVQQRRQSLVQKIKSTGGQSNAYLIEVAAMLGYTITITEFSAFTVGDTVDELIYGDDWEYAFQVNSALNTVEYFEVDDTVADPLATFGNDQLECVLEDIKPAHTIAIFAYT